jgi:hypothetical protein
VVDSVFLERALSFSELNHERNENKKASDRFHFQRLVSPSPEEMILK